MEITMKGPSGRRRHPIRRTWECPQCKKRTITSGKVVHLLCSCTTDPARPTWMALVDESRPRPFSKGVEPLS